MCQTLEEKCCHQSNVSIIKFSVYKIVICLPVVVKGMHVKLFTFINVYDCVKGYRNECY